MTADILTRLSVVVSGHDTTLDPVHYAMDLAAVSDEPLDVLVIEEIPASAKLPATRGQASGRKAARAARETSRQCEDRIRELAKERSLQVRVAHLVGSVDDCIETPAEHASCIIIGRSSPGAGQEQGTRIESITERTHKPLLLIPTRYRPLRRIVVGYAGKELGELALKTASDLATALELPLEVITVADHRDECYPIQERAQRHLKPTTAHVTFSGVTGDPADVLIERTEADHILVMGASGHSRLHRMILGTVAEKVIDNASGPVLVSAKLLHADSVPGRSD